MTKPDPLVPFFRAQLLRDPTSLDELKAGHSPDASGRCPICRADGIKSGRVHSPCNILAAVLEAKKQP